MAVELNLQDIVSARLEFAGPDGTIAYNILHYRLANAEPVSGGTPPFTGIPMEDAGSQIAEAVLNWVDDEWQAAAATSVSMTGCTAQNVWPLPKSRQFHYILETPAPGLLATDALPLQDAPCLVKRSIYGQRWGLGRMFFVGCPEGGQAGGILSDAQAALINAMGTALLATIPVVAGGYTLSFVPVLPSYDDVGVPRSLNIVEFQLTDKVIKTMRRRRPGKGK